MKNLVCAGGGIKGFYYLGIIKRLEELNIIEKLENLCGVSGGSMIIVLLALNYKYSELYDILIDYNKIQALSKLKDALPLDSLSNKIKSFNCNCISIRDGHSFKHLIPAFSKKIKNKPNKIFLLIVKNLFNL